MVVESRTEAFIELYDADTGYNLRHFKQGPPDNDPHVTGEDCPCGPERVKQVETPDDGDIPDAIVTANEARVPTCSLCRRERTLQDAYDYNPIQALTGRPLGWYSGDDGEMCPECMTKCTYGQ